MGMILFVIKTMRPEQWYKNLLVFVPVVLSLNLTDINAVILSLAGFAVLCMSSGGSYVINDLIDYRNDLLHPEKKKRPIALGKISKNEAIVFAIFLIVASQVFAFLINVEFFVINSLLIISMMVYSVRAKNIFLIDVFFISVNYVLRATAGAFIIDVNLSPWLIIGIFLLALLLAFGKRKSEIIFFQENALELSRVLKKYSKNILKYSTIIISATIIITYSLYSMNGPEEIGDWRLVLTIPVVFFILFFYTGSLFAGGYKGKELNDLLLSEKRFFASIIVYIVMTIILIYFVPDSYFK